MNSCYEGKYPVRTSAKAVIIHDNKLLVVTHKENGKLFHTLPGGGQNRNENLPATLRRECLEEAGAEVDVLEMLFVRDYIADNHEFSGVQAGFHQVELMFHCRILNPGKLGARTEPDSRQVGIDWLSVDKLGEYPLYPRILAVRIPEFLKGSHHKEVYLGDVN